MIKVNFRDGTTIAFNLNDKDDMQQWREWSTVPDFQNRITGVGIVHNKRYYALPTPKNFDTVRLEAELVFSEKNGQKRQTAERLICIADNIKTSILVYTYTDPLPPIQLRVDVTKLKRRRWNRNKVFERR